MIQTIFDLIDTRAFSSLWYWILVAVVWSVVTRRVLEIPIDLALRARTEPAAEVLTRELLTWRRMRPGTVWVVVVSCALTVLLVLGFGSGFEAAQAVAMLAVPVTAVQLLDMRAARRAQSAADGAALARVLLGHHVVVQVIAFASIGATALFGMVKVLRAHYLGV